MSIRIEFERINTNGLATMSTNKERYLEQTMLTITNNKLLSI